MKKYLLVLSTLIALSGCATSPISSKAAKNVPSERIFLNNQLHLAGNASVVFVRDVGFTGSGVYQHLHIDGKKVASLDPGEKVEFILPPGEHIFGAIPTDGFGVHAFNTIDQELKVGKKYYYRIQTDGNSFRTVIQRYIPETE